MFDISSPSTYIPAIFVCIVAAFVSYLYKDSKKHTHENTIDLPYYTEIEITNLEETPIEVDVCIHDASGADIEILREK